MKRTLVVTELWRSQALWLATSICCVRTSSRSSAKSSHGTGCLKSSISGWVGRWSKAVTKALGDRLLGCRRLCSADLGRAVLAALDADVEPWQDIHVQSSVREINASPLRKLPKCSVSSSSLSDSEVNNDMKVLILGGCGMLGPWVVKALKHRHEIILTDINPPGDEF